MKSVTKFRTACMNSIKLIINSNWLTVKDMKVKTKGFILNILKKIYRNNNVNQNSRKWTENSSSAYNLFQIGMGINAWHSTKQNKLSIRIWMVLQRVNMSIFILKFLFCLLGWHQPIYSNLTWWKRIQLYKLTIFKST